MSKEKVILAYSGGLDTTVIIPWLKENYDYDVIAVAVDVERLERIQQRVDSSSTGIFGIGGCFPTGQHH